jgi:hypothetical protein
VRPAIVDGPDGPKKVGEWDELAAEPDPDIDAELDEILGDLALVASLSEFGFNPGQPRDGAGRWKGSGRAPSEPKALSGQTRTVRTAMGDRTVPVEFVRKDEAGNDDIDWAGWKAHDDQVAAVRVDRVKADQRDLPDDVGRSITTYQSAFGVHQAINGDLRAGKTDVMHVSNLDAAIGSSSLSADTPLHRGVQFKTAKEQQKFMAQLEPGAVVSDAGYMSTTLDESTASQFAGFGTRPAVTFNINAPAGTNFLYLGDREHELLLPRGTKLRVLGVRPGVSVSKWDSWEVDVEVVLDA